MNVSDRDSEEVLGLTAKSSDSSESCNCLEASSMDASDEEAERWISDFVVKDLDGFGGGVIVELFNVLKVLDDVVISMVGKSLLKSHMLKSGIW